MIKEHEQINQLLDIYGNLLTPYQIEIMDYYYRENYSLSEISDLKGISRNAVSLLLKRVVKSLFDYDEKLNLIEKYNKILTAVTDPNSQVSIVEILMGGKENGI